MTGCSAIRPAAAPTAAQARRATPASSEAVASAVTEAAPAAAATGRCRNCGTTTVPRVSAGRIAVTGVPVSQSPATNMPRVTSVGHATNSVSAAPR